MLCESFFSNVLFFNILLIRSFKGRFRVMKDGQIRRWKEGKRHNAHLKVCFPSLDKQDPKVITSPTSCYLEI